MPAWWREEGWLMSYSGDSKERAEERASELRKEGKEAKVVSKMVTSLAGKPYMEYTTLYRKDD